MPGVVGRGREARPAVRVGAEVARRHAAAEAVGVQARTLVGLQLEQLEVAGVFGGGGENVQPSLRVGEHDAGVVTRGMAQAALQQKGGDVDGLPLVRPSVRSRSRARTSRSTPLVGGSG